MGAIKSGFRISIYKDRTNGDKNVRKMKKKTLLILGIDEFMVDSNLVIMNLVIK